MSRASGAAIHARHLAAKNPGVRVPVDVFLTFGQSNAAQTTPNPNLDPFTTTTDVAWGVTRAPQPDRTLSGPFQNGASVTPHFGQSNGWGKWAEEWYSQIGRRSIWANFAVAGQQLCSISNPAAPQQWSVEDMNKSLVGDFVYNVDEYTRRQLIHHVFDAIGFNPRFTVGNVYVIWVQGEQDANLNATGIEAAYETQLDALFTFCKSEWGVDAFFVVELGRSGTDASEIAANETAYQKIRNAQSAVVASRADTHMIFTGCKAEGSPLNTLTVDGSGYWVSGFDYQSDGVHYETASYYTLGKTGARNALQALGLI